MTNSYISNNSDFGKHRRLDVDGSKEVSEAEVTEGLFLLCGAELDSDGFSWISRGISDTGNLNKDQFKKVFIGLGMLAGLLAVQSIKLSRE